MATAAQMKALLAVPCTWCGVQAGQRCRVRLGRGRTATVPTTLDGESHDARWQAALRTTAPVLTGVVAEHRDGYSLAASGATDRPW